MAAHSCERYYCDGGKVTWVPNNEKPEVWSKETCESGNTWGDGTDGLLPYYKHRSGNPHGDVYIDSWYPKWDDTKKECTADNVAFTFMRGNRYTFKPVTWIRSSRYDLWTLVPDQRQDNEKNGMKGLRSITENIGHCFAMENVHCGK